MILKVEILSLTDDTIRFLLQGCDVSFANALRRTMIMDVPCMTIDDIFILDNSSVMPDEILSHRLGLIPLRTDLDSYVLPEKCKCDSELGCSLCRVILTLNVVAEGDTRVIYSGDLISEDPLVVPSSPDIQIVKLASGQAVRFEAYARLGTGKIHAKWQPVSNCTFQHVAEIEIDDERCTLCSNCIDACPRDVLRVAEGKLGVDDIYACTLCGRCVEACLLEPPAIIQNMKDDTFLFTVESTGNLSPERIVTEAAKILLEKLDELSGKLERGETYESIEEFEVPEEISRRLYSVGTGDFEVEDEE